jgi:uracil-DNA glycosylase
MIWSNVVGSWDRFLYDILNDEDIIDKLNEVNLLYKYSNNIYPKQEDVFNAFKKCPYDKLSTVILGQDPYHDGSATGLSFANIKNTKKLSPSLRIIKDTIIRTVYNGHDFDFDPSLIPWAEQGILLLNTVLTVKEGKPLSHQYLWFDFIQKVLIKLSEVNSGIIYCLWGKYAESYSVYINSSSNTILRCNHPVYSIYQGIPWECDHFIKINSYLKNFNNTTIKW